jgi:hypothetical protein
LNINAAPDNEYSSKFRLADTEPDSCQIGGKSSKKSSSAKTSLTSRRMSSSSVVNGASDSKALKRQARLSDQHWALFFILILVLFAFVIAFLANSLYKSYFEIPQDEL